VLKQYGKPARRRPAAKRLQQDAEAFAAQGADKPFLDVWFEDEKKGFAIGAFNLILRTEDGGKTWTPWLDRIDNPRRCTCMRSARRVARSTSSASRAWCSSSTASSSVS
jgi:photosystem II stability/assembly factor-like uncharacterized protein